MLKTLNDYVFKMEYLRNGEMEDIYGTALIFYTDDSSDKQVSIFHSIDSETGMPVSSLIKLVVKNGTPYVPCRHIYDRKACHLPMILWNH